MNKIILVTGLAVFLLLACNEPYSKLTEETDKPVILLQPLSFNDAAAINFLKDSIEQFYNVTIEIAKPAALPAHAYYKPRNRFRADSIIAWLHTIKQRPYRSVVAVTNSDVSVTKSTQADFGVMGLGYKPGDACVVSTYRLKPTAKSAQHLRERLFKVVAHEMGHNFSLDHCADQQCIMVDAEAKMKLDGIKGLCESCKQKLRL